ncbi:hypothetical protein RRG08_016200 [Elysia crispata]|uniref:Uncharacterized protein n=1 Tax=Elysia crispata TaxID=231223 RepID=A0AAE0ZQE6_9GAST|nr:hypothetical protein RRG08_016200 [Elysia crispata]
MAASCLEVGIDLHLGALAVQDRSANVSSPVVFLIPLNCSPSARQQLKTPTSPCNSFSSMASSYRFSLPPAPLPAFLFETYMSSHVVLNMSARMLHCMPFHMVPNVSSYMTHSMPSYLLPNMSSSMMVGHHTAFFPCLSRVKISFVLADDVPACRLSFTFLERPGERQVARFLRNFRRNLSFQESETEHFWLPPLQFTYTLKGPTELAYPLCFALRGPPLCFPKIVCLSSCAQPLTSNLEKIRSARSFSRNSINSPTTDHRLPALMSVAHLCVDP